MKDLLPADGQTTMTLTSRKEAENDTQFDSLEIHTLYLTIECTGFTKKRQNSIATQQQAEDMTLNPKVAGRTELTHPTITGASLAPVR